ncbi:MAG: SPFH domain-containing protein [Gammaproteobacteria bacterium]|nr:SPFH domain-containing protein [Gammaproteobacteria bacterium]
MKVKSIILGLIGLVIIIGYFACTEIQPFQQGVMANKSQKVLSPGLYVTLPILDAITPVDMRDQASSLQSIAVTTQDKIDLLIDVSVLWKISNITTFAKATALDNTAVNTALIEAITPIVKQKIATQTLAQVLGSTSNAMIASLSASLNQTAEKLGIQIIDVNLQNVNYAPDMLNAAYQKMQATSKQAVAAVTTAGQQQAAQITSQGLVAASAVSTNALVQAATIRGQAEAQAQLIYNAAYAKDPQFFAFWRSLQLYQQLFANKQTVMLVKPQGQFLQYLNTYKP